MNYLSFGGRFWLHYAYVDLNTDLDYVADSLFYRHKVPVKFGEEMTRTGDKYRVIFCKIRKEYKEEFETRHPRVVAFIERQLISGELPAGTILEVSITRPDQDKVTTNMRVAPEDVEVIRELKNL